MKSTSPPPRFYLLNGEDEYAIAQFIASLDAKLGNRSAVDLNKTHLDGKFLSFSELLGALQSAAMALPFLAERRLVVLENAVSQLQAPEAQEKFTQFLEKVPPSTALVIVEHHLLTDRRMQRRGETHWLESWVRAQGERAYVRSFPLEKKGGMVRAVQNMAKQAGVVMRPRAAALLAEYSGEDTWRAQLELQKLCAYVGYARPIEEGDVEEVVLDASEVNIFDMVDALGLRQVPKALSITRRLLTSRDPVGVFGMIVRQFRLLILAREAIDGGKNLSEAQKLLGAQPFRTHSFVVKKAYNQARGFKIQELEAIYRKLLQIDIAVKTGEMPLEAALESFIASLSLG